MTQERICMEPGCNELGQHMGRYYQSGNRKGMPYRRARCTKHHQIFYARKKGLSDDRASHVFHPYLFHRKNYCENQDGRLGFKCTTTIYWPGMLDVDHIDGNPFNEDVSNYQTLCKCCHAYKSWKEKDYLTPGRKTAKV